MSATVAINGRESSIVVIKGRFLQSAKRTDRKAFFLTDEAAGIPGLSERVSEVRLFAGDENVGFRKITAGAFLAEKEIDSWSYSVDISDRGRRSGLAFVSASDGTNAVLMLDDLLPITGGKRSALVRLDIPRDRQALTVETRTADGQFDFANVEKAVLLIGSEWLVKQGTKNTPTVAIRGKWHFSDNDLSSFAAEIVEYYSKMFGGAPTGEILVAVSLMPPQNGFGSWEADTRGRTVNIFMSDTAFATQSKQRLHEILRHELFHLWLPNGVNFDGNYAWFYEGAAVYASLRAAVAMNRIRFDDMLDTLSRAYRIEMLASEPLSLVAMSGRSWSGNDSRMYARGMITAFMIDIEMLAASGGKRSFETLLREIYLKHRPNERSSPATESILSVFGSYPELKPLVSSTISGDQRVDWRQAIAKAGLVDANSRLTVSARLSGKQKALLDDLGYNAWRKLIR
ncbi:MAG: hypothetical protein IPM50_13060 [Acidobacteriota bacterium]|nr:MAG: hypothetical protein IPM50_13060 [Acidobacteriota bacterium]